MIDVAFWLVVAIYLFCALQSYRHARWVRRMRTQIAKDLEKLQ